LVAFGDPYQRHAAHLAIVELLLSGSQRLARSESCKHCSDAAGGRLTWPDRSRRTLRCLSGKAISHNPDAGKVAVGRMPPAIVEHTLGAPLIRHVLDEIAEKRGSLAFWDDRTRTGMPLFEIVSERR